MLGSMQLCFDVSMMKPSIVKSFNIRSQSFFDRKGVMESEDEQLLALLPEETPEEEDK